MHFSKRALLSIVPALICLSQFIYAQGLELGFRLESQALQAKYSDGSRQFFFVPAPECLQVSAGVYARDNLAFEVRGGAIYFDEYTGYEYGLYSKYFLSKLFYTTGGLAVHYTPSDGGHIGGGTITGSILMPSLALGSRLLNHISFELLYQHGSSKPYAYDIYSGKMSVDWIVKAGIVFTWNDL